MERKDHGQKRLRNMGYALFAVAALTADVSTAILTMQAVRDGVFAKDSIAFILADIVVATGNVVAVSVFAHYRPRTQRNMTYKGGLDEPFGVMHHRSGDFYRQGKVRRDNLN